ncbi:MAG: hypothetical protein KC466_04805, partial [Myxococcales bacterium]|nr:hypothetical protein [Myxococcales bacterium]
MDRSRQRKVALAWGFLLAALVLNVVVTQRSLDRSVRPVDAASEWFFLPPTPLLRGLAMGYDHAVADYLWIKTMWFLGDPDFGGRDYATLARMLDVVTDLKPRFYYLYRLGGSYLGFGPDGARAAVALLGEGREAYPDDWMMPFLMGFNYFYHLKDPGSAATYFAEAAKIPGSPRYLGALAARLHAQAHDTRAALMLLAQVAKAEPDPAI